MAVSLLLAGVAAMPSAASAEIVQAADITLVQNALQNNKYSVNGTASFQFGGVNVINVKNQGELLSFCSQFFIGGADGDVDITPGLALFTPLRQQQIAALFSNALPLFNLAADNYRALNGGSLAYNPALDAEFNGSSATNYARYGAALQNAFWEITDETAPGASLDLASGNFGVFSGRFDAERDQLSSDWLANVRDGTWTDNGGVNYFYADSGSNQDHLWVSTAAVPEPATWAMMITGFGFIGSGMRRRSAKMAIALAA
ncbi:PEPxxWA-CTERM sorting domain-containing protein [Sphingobium boeckii]|uniref:Ice-binding protein C-terminal domain-containing protein n=1 Tax=Sphingobium boeckii TaxID=1082345 RepID=A0A7W9AIR3_9SPHN|nr:PEPxxWA-CTERM sorting domain-containing protein [Sphingobium boeckii]MBB5686423.1 hypothetical protein [Sphingobium boeckii]